MNFASLSSNTFALKWLIVLLQYFAQYEHVKALRMRYKYITFIVKLS